MEDFFEDMKNRPRPNIFRRIYLWWSHDGRYYYKYLRQGIKNLWYWFPVIWKDRNWDMHFIYEVIKHKLEAQAKYIDHKNLHVQSKKDARNMRTCVELIKRLQDQYYTSEYQDYHKDRVWFTDCKDKPGYSQYNSEVIFDNFDEYFKKYPLAYKKVLKGEGPFTLDGRNDKELKRVIAMNIGNINHYRAKSLLFKIMDNQIESWWN